MIDLTALTANGHPLVAPKLNRKRAVFVLGRADEPFGWEQRIEQKCESRFVSLGR